MRLLLVLAVCVALASTAPQSRLQFDNNDNNGKQFIEEVVVESVLHVRSPTSARQGRTNNDDLITGARVSLLQPKQT